MASANLPIIPGNLPEGYCYPNSPQELLNKFAEESQVSLESSSFTIIITSASQPAATDRDKLWYNTTDDRFYKWFSGAWVARHPYNAASPVRLWWNSDLTTLQTFDGGDAGTAGNASGPMWEEDTAYRGRMPIHVGSLPSGASVALGDTGGADTITLSTANMADHNHYGQTYIRGTSGSATVSSDPSGNSSNFYHEDSGHTENSQNQFHLAGLQTTSVVETIGEAFNNLNPYKAGYWIKRTSRIYYRA